MRKNLIEDERIITQKRKIQSDTCNIVLIVLLMSTIVQQYIFNAPNLTNLSWKIKKEL